MFIMALADAGEGDLHPGYLSSRSVSRVAMEHVNSTLIRPSWGQNHRLLIVPWGFVRDVTHWLASLAFSLLVDRSPSRRDILPVDMIA